MSRLCLLALAAAASFSLPAAADQVTMKPPLQGRERLPGAEAGAGPHLDRSETTGGPGSALHDTPVQAPKPPAKRPSASSGSSKAKAGKPRGKEKPPPRASGS